MENSKNSKAKADKIQEEVKNPPQESKLPLPPKQKSEKPITKSVAVIIAAMIFGSISFAGGVLLGNNLARSSSTGSNSTRTQPIAPTNQQPQAGAEGQSGAQDARQRPTRPNRQNQTNNSTSQSQ